MAAIAAATGRAVSTFINKRRGFICGTSLDKVYHSAIYRSSKSGRGLLGLLIYIYVC